MRGADPATTVDTASESPFAADLLDLEAGRDSEADSPRQEEPQHGALLGMVSMFLMFWVRPFVPLMAYLRLKRIDQRDHVLLQTEDTMPTIVVEAASPERVARCAPTEVVVPTEIASTASLAPLTGTTAEERGRIGPFTSPRGPRSSTT